MIHQPAEEVPGGAKAMIENGVLDGVDHVLGVHVMSTMKTGNVYYRPGYVQTGRAFFKLKVQGKVVVVHHHIWPMMPLLQVATSQHTNSCI